ncbi:hypothetical protein Hdeb2414_s0018g00524191 [Helianthus debilis subsp. tardiflorus]
MQVIFSTSSLVLLFNRHVFLLLYSFIAFDFCLYSARMMRCYLYGTTWGLCCGCDVSLGLLYFGS